MQKFCSSANTVYSDVDSQNYPTDLRAALGVKDLEDYCEKLESSGAQYRFINNFNSPMDLGNLYRSFLRETPDILLVDGKPGLVKQIQDYVENLMVLGQGLTPQRALILNGLLPPQFCQGFKRLHNKLKFPQDHHVDTNSMAGWYNITGNLILAADKSQLGITIYFRYQPIFPREFLHSKGLPSDAYLVQSVYLTVSTGSTFSHNSGGLVMSNSDAATHSIALQSQVFFSVGNSYLNSKDSNLENLVIGAVDLDSGTGLPISVRLVLKSEKPMIAHYNYYSQGYSYPRYTVADLGLQYNGKTAVATDFLMDQSFFRVDHRWVFGGMTNMHTYVENPLLRAISNFYKKTPEVRLELTHHEGLRFSKPPSLDQLLLFLLIFYSNFLFFISSSIFFGFMRLMSLYLYLSIFSIGTKPSYPISTTSTKCSNCSTIGKFHSYAKIKNLPIFSSHCAIPCPLNLIP